MKHKMSMRIYFSGIGGSALAPLAELSLDAGYNVVGSDQQVNQNTDHLRERGVNSSTDQSGDFLRYCHQQQAIDWMIYTSALPNNHPELETARQLGIQTTKRDQFIPWFIQQHQFKLIAVAGAHGKTSTTTMLIWLMRELGIPISYLVGSTLPFAESGKFDPASRYFIYECDEYDRNFLHYQPDFSLIPAVDYDHIDIYPTLTDYQTAFVQFFSQSKKVFMWQKDLFPTAEKLTNLHFASKINPDLTILGQHNRANAQLILDLLPHLTDLNINQQQAIEILNHAPRAGRRFEVLEPHNLVSDYAHHPAEISATLELAREYADQQSFEQIIAVYEPHQNDRQCQFRDDYPNAFKQADQIYWLPTYVARDHHENILSPTELVANIPQASPADFNDKLINSLKQHLRQNHLVVLMTAGKLDSFVRHNLL
ncbi:MAG: Mur ligase domain-containing protein [Candidatus Saccharibacteria bacterium]|nr:Mur ligase domain-containing protein [Candidatus Saccharibacteria bacterium]